MSGYTFTEMERLKQENREARQAIETMQRACNEWELTVKELRRKLEQARGDVAVMREAIQIAGELVIYHQVPENHHYDLVTDTLKAAHSTTAGAEYAERIRKLEQTAELAKLYLQETGINFESEVYYRLSGALAALEDKNAKV